MPNWCDNELFIAGKSGVSACLSGICTDESPISFRKILPQPAELEGTSSPARIMTQAQIDEQWRQFKALSKDVQTTHGGQPIGLGITRRDSAALILKYGTNNWYDWRVNNWGVKWDASEGVMLSVSETKARMRFNTPWCPPGPAIRALSAQYPDLKFRLKWWECGMAQCGEMHYVDGELVQETSRDYQGSRGG